MPGGEAHKNLGDCKTSFLGISQYPLGQIAAYFGPENPYVSRGRYSVEGKILKFSTEGELGSVEYMGIIEEGCLLLLKHSLINGRKGLLEYKFQRTAWT